MTADFTWSQRCTHDAAMVGGSIPRMKRKRCRINVLLLDAAERRGEGGAKEEKEEDEGKEATRVSAESLKEMAGFEWARS